MVPSMSSSGAGASGARNSAKPCLPTSMWALWLALEPATWTRGRPTLIVIVRPGQNTFQSRRTVCRGRSHPRHTVRRDWNVFWPGRTMTISVGLPRVHVAGSNASHNAHIDVGRHGFALFLAPDAPAPLLDIDGTI